MSDNVKKRLLVVDDEKEICNFVKMFFEQRGIKVLQASNADEAVAAAASFSPHVVLLDVMMKGSVDGLTTLPRIREVAPDAKVLMTTGVDDEISIVRAKSLGACDYITKPLVLEDLETTVFRYMKEL
jgi:two-component system OmpR family response regulator